MSKPDFDDTIIAYDYRAQLAYVMTFDHLREEIYFCYIHMCGTNVVC